jgi:phospholipid/cholesterol/gamma-HCH transport system substrate-binding protein
MHSAVRPLTGLATIVVIIGIVAGAVTLFRGDLSQTVPVTLLSPRAGLVMNPDAKVKMRGVQVGKVSSIDELPDGQAALHLEMDPSQLQHIPSNVVVDIASTTVFGAKSVELAPPPEPSPNHMYAGQILNGQHVTVEINTVFQQATEVLGSIAPEKLNETLGAIADFDAVLTHLDPSLPALDHELAVLPTVVNAYADVAPDLIQTLDNTTRISQTIVDEQQDLDAVLVSATGLADVGNDVIGTNRQPLADVLHLLVPTTDLTNEYHDSLHCGLAGMGELASGPQSPSPGIALSIGFLLGVDRYRYPSSLPKVAAKSSSQCESQSLPAVPPGVHPPFLVADVGANPWQYGNQGILLNSDALKQFLFGPIDGPPRNTAQIGQPG